MGYQGLQPRPLINVSKLPTLSRESTHLQLWTAHQAVVMAAEEEEVNREEVRAAMEGMAVPAEDLPCLNTK